MTTSPTAELTIRAIFLGIVLSVVMGAANLYLGLKAGMTVSASIPAAVIAMVILRGLFKNGTILESNQVQTSASAGESLAAGIIFTMPAMVMVGVWQEFDMVLTTIIAFTGGLLGILFMIPMRKVFVVSEDSDLKYPEGVACAAVLKAGEESSEGSATSIFWGAGIGAIFKIGISFLGVMKGTLEGAALFSGRIFYMGGDISPALVSVGFIVGLNVAILIFIGGAIAWLIGIPVMSGGVDVSGGALDTAWGLWSTKIRYVGVGAMVVGGVASIWRVRGGLAQAIKGLKKRSTPDELRHQSSSDRDLPANVITGLVMLAVALVGGVYFYLTGNVAIAVVTTIIMILMCFFFTAVASYIVGLVGNSNSPVSGMTITAVLFTGILLLLFGFTGAAGMAATLGVAAIVCCAACTSGDVCNDLKTGQIVGAAPYRQQIMQVIGVAVACLVMAPILQLLHNHTAGGIGGRELPAPQAALFASLVEGFFGEGSLPWNLVGVGAVIGVAFLGLDFYLEKSGSAFRAHLMPIAVGMYLPFGLATPILNGGILNWLITKGQNEEDAEKLSRKGVLFASGTIAGESLMGVGIALLASVGITKLELGVGDGVMTALTCVAAVLVIMAFRKISKPANG